MEKVLDKNIVIFLALFILFISCKGKKENKNIVSHKVSVIKTEIHLDCLNKEDIKKIDQFKGKLETAIINKDTLSILSYVKLPFDNTGTIVNKDRFLRVEIEMLMSYFSKNVMDEEEALEVVVEEKFLDKENTDCKQLYINNSFPESEFNFIMYFDEIEGEIKLIKFIFAG